MFCTRKLTRTIFALAVIPVLLFLAAPSVFAQQQAPQQQQPQEAPDIEVNDDELEAAARAYVEVEEITAEYRAEFGQTQDPQEAAQIQQELRSETDAAIEDQGLDPDRYDNIIRAARADEELRDELISLIEEYQRSENDGS